MSWLLSTQIGGDNKLPFVAVKMASTIHFGSAHCAQTETIAFEPANIIFFGPCSKFKTSWIFMIDNTKYLSVSAQQGFYLESGYGLDFALCNSSACDLALNLGVCHSNDSKSCSFSLNITNPIVRMSLVPISSEGNGLSFIIVKVRSDPLTACPGRTCDVICATMPFRDCRSITCDVIEDNRSTTLQDCHCYSSLNAEIRFGCMTAQSGVYVLAFMVIIE